MNIDRCFSTHLSNRDWYTPIPVENVQTYNKDYDVIISVAYNDGIIDILEVLKVPHPKIPSFYSLPKTHKNIRKPPGCPIISGIGAKTEKGSHKTSIVYTRHYGSIEKIIWCE